MLLDYEMLRIIWWILLGILLTGFAVMDGFDLGIGMLLHRVAKSNTERRVVLNTIGPVWEGNQIWLILGAGAIFAAWPMVYSLLFSGFYFAMLLVLLALILRPLGFKYRAKIDHTRWRALWDAVLFIAGFVPALIFGIAAGNILQGVPFYFDDTLRLFYTGDLIHLFNPFGILCGLVSITMLVMHGGTFLCIKTDRQIQQRARFYARISAILLILLFSLAGYMIIKHMPGYVITSMVSPDEPSNPLYKQVMIQTGAWSHNYQAHPLWMAAPIAGLLGALLTIFFLSLRRDKTAWFASSLSITGVITTVGVSMFPFIMPSSTHPGMSLLLWDSSSSQMTLLIMLIAALIFIPIIIGYTSWIYYVMRGKVSEEDTHIY
jgi:cytochrome bd ubiquinol oxidase subunit II